MLIYSFREHAGDERPEGAQPQNQGLGQGYEDSARDPIAEKRYSTQQKPQP